ncbi:MAG: sensor histidine kinase [Ornithinimicrobium sp.]
MRASTLSVTGPGSPTPKDPWERYGWLMSAVWLIFLVFPLTSVLSSSIALGWQLFGIVDILAFAVVHTMAFIRVESCPTPDARRTLGVTAFGVLTVLAAVMAPIIGWGALGLTPFLVSFSAFFFRPRTGVILTMTLLVLAGLGVWQAGPELWIFPGILLMVSVSTHMIAALDQRQREHRELRTQMSLTNERDRVARDVHDVLGHSLTVITVKAELAERLVDIDPAQARAELAEIQALSRRSLNEVRATVGGLRAARLEDELRTTHVVLRDAGIDLHVRGEIGEVDPQHRTVLAWVLREAVTNVVRHSRATTCVVTLDRSSLTVTDNGRGMKVSRPGNGIRGLTERVEAVGGRLDLTPAGAGPGTSLTVHL